MFDAGSIIAKFKVDSSDFDKRLKSAGNSIDGMQSRIDRLQKLVNKSDFGSPRFQKLSEALNQANADMSRMQARAQGTTSVMATLGKTIAAIGVAQFGKSVFDITKTFEKYNAVLKNSLGSQEEAAKAMQLIQNFAAKTPFSVDELTAAYIKFVNRGIKPTKEELTALGDIASSQGKSFDQLTEAILDATQGEFERLKEFGIRATSAGNQVQLAFKGVNLEVAKTPEAINAALIQLGKMEGVAGSMAAISDTLEGQVSNLGDSFDSLQVTLGQALAPVMKTVISIIASMIQGLTEFVTNNKELIKQIAQVAAVMVPLIAGFKAFNMIMVGLPAVIGSVGRALTVAFGPASLAITGIALLINYIINARGELQKFREDAIKSAGQKIAPQDLDMAIAKLQAFNREFGSRGVIQATSIETMNRMNEKIKELSQLLGMTEADFRKAFIQGGGGAVVVARTEIAKATDDLRKMKTETASTGATINTTFRGGKIAVEETKNEIQATSDVVADTKSNFEQLGQSLQQIFSGINQGLEAAMTNLMQRLQNNLQNVQRRINIFNTFASVYLEKMRRAQEDELKFAEENSQRELENFKKIEQDKVNAVRTAEQEKIDALKKAQIEKEALANSELQNRLAQLEAEKLAYIDQKRLEFEREQMQILMSVESQKNKTLALQANEQDWLAFLETINGEYRDRELALANEFKTEREVSNAELKANIEQQEAQSNAAIEAEELASNERIKAEEQRQAEKLQAIKEKQEQEKRDAEKKSAFIKYTLDVAAMEVSKQVARATAGMALAQSLMYATLAGIAITAFSAPFMGPFAIPLGVAAGATLAALAVGTYSMTLAGIGSQFVVPPAELFMEDGGVLGGKRHMNGGTRMGSIEAERGELFVNRARTEQLFNWMDSGMSMGGVVVYIQPGAFQGVGDLSDESVQIIGRKIGEQISRRSF
jgi:hypothetical protein